MESSTATVPMAPAPKPLLTLLEDFLTLLLPYFPPQTSSHTSDSTSKVHLTLTYATSLDAQISLRPGVQTYLSGPLSKAMTHFMRSRHDAILVGVNTANVDDPGLNCRYVYKEERLGECKVIEPQREKQFLEKGSFDWKGGKEVQQPVPVILDPNGRWMCRQDSRLLTLARSGHGKAPFWLVNSSTIIDDTRQAHISSAGGILLHVPDLVHRGEVRWDVVLTLIVDRGLSSVMVEGGGTVIRDLLRRANQRFVTSVVVTIAPVWLGEGGVGTCPVREKGVAQDKGEGVGRLEGVKWVPMGDDVVLAGRFAQGLS